MTIKNFLESSPQNFIPLKSLPTLSDGMTIGNAFHQMREKGVALSLHQGPDRYTILTPQNIIKYCQTKGDCSESDIIDEVAAAQKPLVVMQVSQPARRLRELIEQKKVVALASAGDIIGLVMPGNASAYFVPGEPEIAGHPRFILMKVYCPEEECHYSISVQLYDEDNPPMCPIHNCPMVTR
ncbi:MAG: hypothetical protein ACLP2P_00580 [Desulfobaccales bacterium]